MDTPGNINLLKKTESSQALARFIIVSIVAVYIGGLVLFTEQPAELVRIAVSAATYCPIAGLWWYFVRQNPLPFNEALWRIYAGIFGDTTMTGLFIAIGGVNMLAIYVIYLWVILGNGMRFGANIMSAATAASIISLSVAAMVSPVWVLPPIATIVFVLGLLIVDMFTRRLLNDRDKALALANRLGQDLREAQLGLSGNGGLLSLDDFLPNVDEQIANLQDGRLLTAVIVRYEGDSASKIGNPHSEHGRRLIETVGSELRGSDIATIGRENELWLLLEPKRLSDALVVAKRVCDASTKLEPSLKTKVGAAAYPMTEADGEGLFMAARANLTSGSDAAHKIRRHLFAVETPPGARE